MERLTKYGKTIHENGVCCTHFMSKECKEVSGNCAYGCKWEEEAWSKLAHYEDLEEQGLLVRLPCKEGTKVYHIAFNYKTTRKEKIVETTFSLEMLEDYKKWWFLTKAEAEKKLAEMEK